VSGGKEMKGRCVLYDTFGSITHLHIFTK